MTSMTQALPLTKGITNQLCFLLIEYFMTNTWMGQVFSSAQYAYKKSDLASKQRPSLFCYPRNDVRTSSMQVDGYIVLELHFSFLEQRVYLAQNLIQIANLIQLIIVQQEFQRYAQAQMPGLFWVGREWRTDYTKAYQQESTVALELNFRVDLQAYQNELQDQGFDITSPDEQIYFAANDLMAQIAVLDNQFNPIDISTNKETP